MEVGAPANDVLAFSRVVAGARRLARPPVAVGLLVALSAALQTILAWRRPTPGYFPDEYMYAELGRSLLESGAPLVRGEEAHFLPLLYPLLTAPVWLWDEVEPAYRSLQAFNAVAMSLAAIPIFLLARRLRVGDRLAVAAAALTVVVPELFYASSALAEPLAYTLALAAAAAAVAALDQPLLRYQVALLAFAVLAAFTRIQLVALLLCYLVAVVAVGLRGGRLRATLREQWLAAGAAAVVLGAGLVLAVGGGLGLYGSLSAYTIDPAVAGRSLGMNALVLAYAVGWVIVPGALIALGLALARPRSSAELAFGAFAATLLVLLLLQASLVGDAGRVQERYLIYAIPLLMCLFCLHVRRGWPLLRTQLLIVALGTIVASAVPLAGYSAAQGSTQSLVLAAVRQLERTLGDVGLASLVVAAGAPALSAVVLVVAWRRPPLATAVALGLTVAVSAGTTAAAAALYEVRLGAVRATYLPADPSWVDAAASDPVTLLIAPRSTRGDLHSTLFWNRSVRSVVMIGGDRPDPFTAPDGVIDGAGRIRAAGKQVSGLVLADTHGTAVLLRDAERLAAGPTKTLWRTGDAAQLRLLMPGRYFDGLLATEGGIRVWPDRRGGRISARLELELDISLPGVTRAVPFRLQLPDGEEIAIDVRRGKTSRLQVPVCSTGVWAAEYATGSVALVHGTRVGLHSSALRLVDDSTACA